MKNIAKETGMVVLLLATIPLVIFMLALSVVGSIHFVTWLGWMK